MRLTDVTSSYPISECFADKCAPSLHNPHVALQLPALTAHKFIQQPVQAPGLLCAPTRTRTAALRHESYEQTSTTTALNQQLQLSISITRVHSENSVRPETFFARHPRYFSKMIRSVPVAWASPAARQWVISSYNARTCLATVSEQSMTNNKIQPSMTFFRARDIEVQLLRMPVTLRRATQPSVYKA